MKKINTTKRYVFFHHSKFYNTSKNVHRALQSILMKREANNVFSFLAHLANLTLLSSIFSAEMHHMHILVSIERIS